MKDRNRVVFGVIGEEPDIRDPQKALENGGYVFAFELPDLDEEFKSMPAVDSRSAYLFSGDISKK